MRTKLTKSVVQSAAPRDPNQEAFYWDEDGTGLGIRVSKESRRDGKRCRYFVFGYRTKAPLGEPGRKPKWRLYQLGKVSRWTLAQARDEVVQLNAYVNRGGDPVADRHAARLEAKRRKTVKDLAVMMMEDYHETTWAEPKAADGKKKESRYIREDRSRWKRWILPKIGKMDLEDVETLHIDRILKNVAELTSGTTANRVRSMLSKAFNQAEVWKLRPQNTNPIKHSLKRQEQTRQRVLSRDELVAVLNATRSLLAEAADKEASRQTLSDQRQFLVVLLAAETMRRPDEIFRLEWSWIRWDKRIVALPQTKADRKGKVIKGQRFGLSERAVEILERARELAGESLYVFPSVTSDGHVTTVRRIWGLILKRAKIEGKPDLYTLKHSMISLSDEAGVALGSISDQVGHHDIATTEIYRRGSDRQKIAAADAVSQYLGSLAESEVIRYGATG